MSTSEIFGAPHAIAVAAVDGPVLSQAAAAVLASRAASLAVEGPARAAVEQTAGEGSLPAWEPVVAAVVELNARIRMLTARAGRAGADADIPPPRERRMGFGVDLRTLGHRLGADVITEEGYLPLDSARERRP